MGRSGSGPTGGSAGWIARPNCPSSTSDGVPAYSSWNSIRTRSLSVPGGTGRAVGGRSSVAATGREVVVDHVEMWRVADGRIVEHWGGLGAGGQLHRALTAP